MAFHAHRFHICGFHSRIKSLERSHIYIELQQSLVFLQQHRVTVPRFVSHQILEHLTYDLKFVEEWTQVTCKSYPTLYGDKLASILTLTRGVVTRDRVYRCID